MPQVSRKRLPPEILKSLSDSLVFAFKDIIKGKEMEAFLGSLLTPTEKLMLAKRIAVAYLFSLARYAIRAAGGRPLKSPYYS